MKKFVSLFLLITFLCGSIASAVEVSGSSINNNFFEQGVNEKNLKLKKEIKDSIVKIYGKESADEIYSIVMNHAQKAVETRPSELKKQDLNRKDDWYKNEIIYIYRE